MTLSDDIAETEARRLLQRIGQEAGERLALAEAALALAAREVPGADLAPYRAHLARLAEDVRAIVGGADPASLAVEEARAALAHVLYGLHGYRGDDETYDDLQNANLIRVIDRRRGLPVALGILAVEVARAQGWEAAGLDFPGHFLVRIACGGERAVIDPFNGARALEAADLRALVKGTLGQDAELATHHYAPAGDKDVLLRLQNNLKLRLIQQHRVDRAADIVDAMLTIAPERPGLWREAGLLHAHLGNLRTALAALETYIEREADGPARREAAQLADDLRDKLT